MKEDACFLEMRNFGVAHFVFMKRFINETVTLIEWSRNRQSSTYYSPPILIFGARLIDQIQWKLTYLQKLDPAESAEFYR
jgi:hypothetical protein